MKSQKRHRTIFKFFFIVGVIFALCVSLVSIYNLREKNFFHRNRMLEHEYLRKIVNESHFSVEYFKRKWGDSLYQQGNMYIVDSTTILTDPYFEDNAYTMGKSDFYGYEFQFDDLGSLKAFSPYKPQRIGTLAKPGT